MAVKIHLNKRGKKEVDSISDGDQFTTIAYTEYDGIYRCHEPGRDEFEFVAVSDDYVASLSYNQEHRLTHDIVVYGDRSAWENTPSSFYSQ